MKHGALSYVVLLESSADSCSKFGNCFIQEICVKSERRFDPNIVVATRFRFKVEMLMESAAARFLGKS